VLANPLQLRFESLERGSEKHCASTKTWEHEETRTYHVCCDEARQVQHWIPIQAQIVLDHPVCNLLWHLPFRHFVLWQILCCKSTAVDSCGEGIIIRRSVQSDALHSFNQWLVAHGIGGDLREVNHFGGWRLRGDVVVRRGWREEEQVGRYIYARDWVRREER
jgi:hypothetical protein